ncbi:tryptophan synthase alpha chain [Streptomyces sp. SAI-195]
MSGNVQLLNDTLAAAKSEGRAALIAYLPAGFPTVTGGIEAVKAALDGGADVVEVGLPHSDPVLDGPVIQTADDIALRGGVRIADVMRTVREAHEATGKPILVMTYWNPIDRYGVERFTAELAEAGGAGCILPDLPVQESALWREHADKHGLATVFVVAPSSRDARLAEITAAGSGFVYAASLMGVTGTRESVGAQAEDLVRRTRTNHRHPGLRRPRRLQRRPGRRGRPVRRRCDRRLGVRQADAGRARRRGRPGGRPRARRRPGEGRARTGVTPAPWPTGRRTGA